MNKKILIIQTGNTHAKFKENNFNFSDMVIRACGDDKSAFLTVNVFEDGVLPEDMTMISGVIITGSREMVTDRLPWMCRTEAWLIKAREHCLPMLGICFGHQLLAQTFGGVVGNHPEGPEVGTVPVTLTPEGREDPLLKTLKGTFLGFVSHTQSVLTLPKDASLLAHNSFEPHHCFKLSPHIYGVQFHPEFTEQVNAENIKAAGDKHMIRDIGPGDKAHADYGTESGYILLKAFIGLCDTGVASK